MQPSILTAIENIVRFHDNDLGKYSSTYLNRINAVGEQLEFYIKDAFANSLVQSQQEKEKEHRRVFSYLGNQNNPPDIIIKNGDAFEIKKIGKPTSALALNSSPPKDALHKSDPRITQDCRACEEVPWDKKDLFYVVGHTPNKKARYIFFVHGLCYAARKEVYEKLSIPLTNEIGKILNSLGLEQGETLELGKVKRVDPLGITELRIRGMWGIQNPIRVFSQIYDYRQKKEFSLAALLTKEKYDSYPSAERGSIEKNKTIKIQNVDVKNPNNPAATISAKLISAGW